MGTLGRQEITLKVHGIQPSLAPLKLGPKPQGQGVAILIVDTQPQYPHLEPNMSDITPQQFITWLRAQAQTFSSMADQLECAFSQFSAFSSGPTAEVRQRVRPAQSSPAQPQPSPTVSAFLTGAPSAEEIRAAVRARNMRVSEIATHFSSTAEAIRKVVESPNSGLHIAERGWVKEHQAAP